MDNESKICVSIGKIPLDNILTILSQVEMAEIRLDLVRLDEDSLEILFSSHKNLIATCREGEYGDKKRGQILRKAIEHGAAWVDVEADSDPEWRDGMIKSAITGDCRLILSMHFFSHTPAPSELRRYTDEMFSMGAHVVKIAAQVNQPSDAAALLGLYSGYKNIVAIGMGPLGVITRIASPFLGSPFTFASFGDNPMTAPGQVEFREMMDLIGRISSI
jgi:3-dehydroquinate dehydratase I